MGEKGGKNQKEKWFKIANQYGRLDLHCGLRKTGSGEGKERKK